MKEKRKMAGNSIGLMEATIFSEEGMTISVPVHGKDVPTSLLQQIMKDAGLKSLRFSQN